MKELKRSSRSLCGRSSVLKGSPPRSTEGSRSIEVTPTPVPNQPPVANAGGPCSGPTGTAIQFNGGSSSDPDGTITTYSWNFGDGTTVSGATPTHAYSTAGGYTATLTVTDNAGATGSASATARVASGAASQVSRITPGALSAEEDAQVLNSLGHIDAGTPTCRSSGDKMGLCRWDAGCRRLLRV
jgi:PKD repeat protein